MGVIKKVLSQRELPDRELHNSRLFVDLSENIHIHFREIRLMFSIDEFDEFTQIIKESTHEVKQYLKQHPAYKEQEVFDGVMVAGGSKRQTTPLRNSPKPHQSTYFPNRLQIELQDEKVIDSIHVHFRDYRMVMNFETFREFAEGMKESLDNLDAFLQDHNYNQKKHPFRKVVEAKEWREKNITFLDKFLHRLKSFFRVAFR